MLIHCPSLTPIQSRLAASCLSLLFLGVIYYALSHTQFAYAAEVSSVHTPGHDGVFPRADALLIDGNNSPNRGNLSPGQSSTWHYPTSLLKAALSNQTSVLPGNLTAARKVPTIAHIDLRKREEHGLEERQASARTVYISINTCSQPTWSGPGPQQAAPPQLTLVIGQPGDQNVGSGNNQAQLLLDDGFASHSLTSSTDVYVAVSAPALPTGFTGNWAYDLAVSIDGFYHAANFDSPFLFLVDSDSNSTLLVTEDLTRQPANSTVYQQWMSLQKLPFAVFASNDAGGKRWGLENSVCGLQTVAEVNTLSNKSANTSMVTRGLNKGPKQQFFISNLTSATTYSASLALVGNGVSSGKGVVGGGGAVWLPTSFSTKSNGNCHLLYDLKFCSDVAYAVPSNPRYDTAALGALYDDYASKLYQNFSYSLQQIQCNTSNDQRYTLARNCDDCAASYKEWLCAVTMPRCEDFSKNETWLYPKNVGQAFFQNGSMLSDEILSQQFQPMPGAPTLPGSPIQQTWLSSYATNQSRNPTIIDQVIKPGPYKEILPCEDVCYDLVQSCPASLQFGCPLPGRGLEAGYGQRWPDRSIIKCNYLGAVYYLDDARQLVPSVLLVVATTALTVFLSLT